MLKYIGKYYLKGEFDCKDFYHRNKIKINILFSLNNPKVRNLGT